MHQTMKIDTSPLILSPIKAERKHAILQSSPGYNPTDDRTFNGKL